MGCILIMWAVMHTPLVSCDCIGPTREGAFQEASAVFVGTVRSIEPVHPANGKFKRGRDRAGSVGAWHAVKFSVVEAFKGVSSSRIAIISAADCWTGFEAGRTYLVYARRESRYPGFLVTGYCDRHYDIERGDDEVKWLRALVKLAG